MKVRYNFHVLFLTFLRIFFGVVFLFSAIMKFIDLNAFTDALLKFKMLSFWQADILTIIFPVSELILGILIIMNIKTSIASLLSTLMLAMFTAVIISKIFEGEQISCGCFGSLTSDNIDYTTVIRNILLIITGILVTSFYTDEKHKSRINIATKKLLYKNTFTTIVMIVFFFLGVQTVIFGLQNRELKNRLMLLSTDKDVLKSGDTAKVFDAYTLENEYRQISFNINKKVLIFLFSTKCSPCKLNIPNWNKLSTELSSLDNNEIIGISMDSVYALNEFVQNNQLKFPVYSTLEDEFKINYKAFLTPQTYLIDENSKIINTWPGILTSINVNEILKILGPSKKNIITEVK